MTDAFESKGFHEYGFLFPYIFPIHILTVFQIVRRIVGCHDKFEFSCAPLLSLLASTTAMKWHR